MSQRIYITREGVYYLFVLMFVIGGAVFREVNLLLVIAAMMFGPILFSWRIVAATTSKLRFHRKLPESIAAGSVLAVDLEVSNDRRTLTTWALEIMDRIDVTSAAGSTEPRTVRTLVSCIPAGETGRVSYSIRANQRGKLHIRMQSATTRYPWGFVAGQVQTPLEAEVVITPRLGRLTPRWTRLLDGRSSLAHHSDPRRAAAQRRGLTDGDYYGMRDWRTGDSRRWIHWRTTAKLNTLSVMQFEQQRHPDLALILDLWQEPHAAPNQQQLVETAVSFAATAIVDSCRRGTGNLLTAIAASQERIWDRNASPLLANEILRCLSTVSAASSVSLERIGDSVRSLMPFGISVIVISTRARVPLGASIDCEWINVGDSDVQNYFQLDG